MNYNIKISADLIKGAEVRKITTWNGNLQDYLCIPIDNYTGTVQNGSKGRDGETRQFKHVYINLEAIEVQSKGLHILKPSVSLERMQSLTEEQLRRRPIVGEMTPWGMKRNNNGQNHE